eukprot:CCRYP_018948-RA/>CCRYP_018948-RA protein AED:0.43 eAED:0.43 QI:0/-1/0/1/-1/1/1/0/74
MNAKLLVEASVKTRDKLDFAMGKGNDGDVPKVSFIEDSREFPFLWQAISSSDYMFCVGNGLYSVNWLIDPSSQS